jgi:hypothetical protein
MRERWPRMGHDCSCQSVLQRRPFGWSVCRGALMCCVHGFPCRSIAKIQKLLGEQEKLLAEFKKVHHAVRTPACHASDGTQACCLIFASGVLPRSSRWSVAVRAPTPCTLTALPDPPCALQAGGPAVLQPQGEVGEVDTRPRGTRTHAFTPSVHVGQGGGVALLVAHQRVCRRERRRTACPLEAANAHHDYTPRRPQRPRVQRRVLSTWRCSHTTACAVLLLVRG